MLMFAATALIVIRFGASIAPGALYTKGTAALATPLLFVLVNAVQASAEEGLFRGWLLQTIGTRQDPWRGVLISSLVFSLAHGIGTGFALLPSLSLFLFGVFLATYALAERGLWGVSAWHALWNWTQGRLLGFPVSGSAGDDSGLLISIRPTGSDLISGGSFGPEGGLPTIVVFLVGITIVLLLDRRRTGRR